MNAPPPITSAQCPDEWIQAVREATERGGWPMRPHAASAAIEFKDPNQNQWRVKMLPGGGVLFTSMAERDLVVGRLLGR